MEFFREEPIDYATLTADEIIEVRRHMHGLSDPHNLDEAVSLLRTHLFVARDNLSRDAERALTMVLRRLEAERYRHFLDR